MHILIEDLTANKSRRFRSRSDHNVWKNVAKTLKTLWQWCRKSGDAAPNFLIMRSYRQHWCSNAWHF